MTQQWYTTGYAGVEAASAEADRRILPFRFWLRVGESAPVVFIDDDPFQHDEHEKAGKDGRPEFFTCSAIVGDDACCQKLEKGTYVGAYTIVNARPGSSEGGKSYQFGLELFVGKIGTLQTLRRKRESLSSFAYTKCDVARDTDKSPKVGNDFTFRDAVKDHDKFFSIVHFKGTPMSKVFDEAEGSQAGWTKWARIFDLESHKEAGKGLIRRVPRFNYIALLEPRRGEELKRFLAGAKAPWGGKGFDKGGARGGGAASSGSQDF